MASLYFRYGAMGCGKTRDLMKVWYNYNEKGKTAIIIKPAIDTKANSSVSSRDGSNHEVDYLIKKRDNIYKIISKHILSNNLDCILVDEAQFLERHHVEELTDVVDLLIFRLFVMDLERTLKIIYLLVVKLYLFMLIRLKK